MTEIEHTEAWLFETQRKLEEKKFLDPDDVYYHARDREEERIQQGLPPRIQFLDEEPEPGPQSDPPESS